MNNFRISAARKLKCKEFSCRIFHNEFCHMCNLVKSWLTCRGFDHFFNWVKKRMLPFSWVSTFYNVWFGLEDLFKCYQHFTITRYIYISFHAIVARLKLRTLKNLPTKTLNPAFLGLIFFFNLQQHKLSFLSPCQYLNSQYLDKVWHSHYPPRPSVRRRTLFELLSLV